MLCSLAEGQAYHHPDTSDLTMLRLGKIDLDMLNDNKALVWIFRGICYKPTEAAILVDKRNWRGNSQTTWITIITSHAPSRQ